MLDTEEFLRVEKLCGKYLKILNFFLQVQSQKNCCHALIKMLFYACYLDSYFIHKSR